MAKPDILAVLGSGAEIAEPCVEGKPRRGKGRGVRGWEGKHGLLYSG